MGTPGFEIVIGDEIVTSDGRRWRILSVKRGVDPHFVARDEHGTTVLTGRLDQLEWNTTINGWLHTRH